MEAALDKELISEFECPVCNEYMCPPIRMCITGHSFCDSCYNKIEICSVCTGQKTTTRNYTLEKLFGIIKFPCKYISNGCAHVLKDIEMKEHIKICDYRAIAL